MNTHQSLWFHMPLTAGESGNIPPCEGQGDQRQQSAYLLGEGRCLVVTVLWMGLPVRGKPAQTLCAAWLRTGWCIL